MSKRVQSRWIVSAALLAAATLGYLAVTSAKVPPLPAVENKASAPASADVEAELRAAKSEAKGEAADKATVPDVRVAARTDLVGDSRVLAGTLRYRSGAAIAGGTVTVMHPLRARGGRDVVVETDSHGHFSMELEPSVFPGETVFVCASDDSSGLFSGFLPIRTDVAIIAALDPTDPSWLLTGGIELIPECSGWVAEVIEPRDAGGTARILATSSLFGALSGGKVDVRMRFLDSADTCHSGAVSLVALRKANRTLLGVSTFRSLDDLRRALSDVVHFEYPVREFVLPKFSDGRLQDLILFDESGLSAFKAQLEDARVSAAVPAGTYFLRARSSDQMVAEADLQIGDSSTVVVEKWDAVIPGTGTLLVTVREGGRPIAGASLKYTRIGRRGLALQAKLASDTTADDGTVRLRGLAPGTYEVRATRADGGADGIARCEVAGEGDVVVHLGRTAVMRVDVCLREIGAEQLDESSARLQWRVGDEGPWTEVPLRGIVPNGWTIARVPSDQQITVVASGAVHGSSSRWGGSVSLRTTADALQSVTIPAQFVWRVSGTIQGLAADLPRPVQVALQPSWSGGALDICTTDAAGNFCVWAPDGYRGTLAVMGSDGAVLRRVAIEPVDQELTLALDVGAPGGKPGDRGK